MLITNTAAFFSEHFLPVRVTFTIYSIPQFFVSRMSFRLEKGIRNISG